MAQFVEFLRSYAARLPRRAPGIKPHVPNPAKPPPNPPPSATARVPQPNTVPESRPRPHPPSPPPIPRPILTPAPGPPLANALGHVPPQDARFALRLLRKTPAFTLVAVLTLGLAVAANTVVFSVVDAVLVRPLPYPDPASLVRIDTQFPSSGFSQFWTSPPEYLALVRDARSYDSVGAWVSGTVNLTGGDHPVFVNAANTTASLLPTLGVQPLLGRFFDASEDTPGPPRAVVIGYGLWQSAFGGDPNVVGKTAQIDAQPVTVVGVMPKGFDYPVAGTEMWIPVRIDRAKMSSSNHYLTVVARLRQGVTIDAARAEIASLSVGWHDADPKGHTIGPKHPMIATRLAEDTVASVRVALLTLQAAVAFVLLIACANISNLLLARAEARSGEIAIRAAVGATRGRMVRQFLTESVVLGLLGAVVGIFLSTWGLDATIALLPQGVPRAADIALDKSVLAFAIGISILASLLFGVAPILHTHGNLGTALRGGQRATSSGRRQTFRRALVVFEIGLAIVLVTGAGLMVRSFVASSTSISASTRAAWSPSTSSSRPRPTRPRSRRRGSGSASWTGPRRSPA